MSSSGFTYKGIDIGNQITSYETNAPTFSKYNLQHTPTNYVYQRPLDFNLSDGGTSLSTQCTAPQITHNSSSNVKYDPPNGATRVNVLLLGGQGGKGGTGGNANAQAISKSAKGNGGGGAVGGFGESKLNVSGNIPEQVKYTITVGEVGNDGNNGNNNTTNGSFNGSSTKGGTGGTGGAGGTSSITFYNGNVVDSNQSMGGGTGGGGGNGGDAKANNYSDKANSNQGGSPNQPSPQNTANGGNQYPDIAQNSNNGFVQIVWLYP